MGPLVDTSALIDYFRGTRNRATEALDRLLSDGPFPATAPVIVQEFLQGLRPRDVRVGEEALAAFVRLAPPSYALHEAAAELFRKARKAGYTASTVDTLIVKMAAHHEVPLLTRDDVQARLAHLADVPLV